LQASELIRVLLREDVDPLEEGEEMYLYTGMIALSV
jgi:hypothetical protein